MTKKGNPHPKQELFDWMDSKNCHSTGEIVFEVLQEVTDRSIGPSPVIQDLLEKWFELRSVNNKARRLAKATGPTSISG